MPNYAKTVMYKIVCKDVNIKKSYGGHTTNLIKRRQKHKSKCNNEKNNNYNSYVYKFIRENGGWDNWEVVWNYDFPCKTKREAELEERKFIELNNCELNSYKPFSTEEEKKEQIKKYKKENKETLAQKIKDYYEKNKDKILEYHKEYQKKNKDKIKIKYEKNKDKILEKAKIKYEKNKDKIKEKRNQKIKCQCGCEISRRNLSKHLKTKKHKKLMGNTEETPNKSTI